MLTSTKTIAVESAVRNVVIFGETGAGKSSVVNMVARNELAKTSRDSTGCTFYSQSYKVEIDDISVELWDTAGLNEADGGTVVAKDAIIHLYKLLKRLEDGISLLVYCVRGPRIKDNIAKNYMMFHHGLCQRKVPIVIVVTGLEEEEDMDDWWVRNEGVFKTQKMSFDGHACITATKGKLRNDKHIFAREYEESTQKVRKLVGDHCHGTRWNMKATSWMVSAVKTMFNMGTAVLNVPPLVLNRLIYEVLKEYGGLSDKEARRLANEVECETVKGTDKPEGDGADADGSEVYNKARTKDTPRKLFPLRNRIRGEEGKGKIQQSSRVNSTDQEQAGLGDDEPVARIVDQRGAIGGADSQESNNLLVGIKGQGRKDSAPEVFGTQNDSSDLLDSSDLPSQEDRYTKTHNIVVFGEIGVGKSSIVNMIRGCDLAETSSGAAARSFRGKHPPMTIDGKSFQLWETWALNGGEEGEAAAKQTLLKLFELIRYWKSGVSLLIYCVRGPRIKESTIYNYQLFYEGLFQKEVPIVLVVTGLEQEDSMDGWWITNEDVFRRQQMVFNGQAGITATKGKLGRSRVYTFEQEYQQSRVKVRKLISEFCRDEPWIMTTHSWVELAAKHTFGFCINAFKILPSVYSSLLCDVLKETGEFMDKDAQELVNQMEHAICQGESQGSAPGSLKGTEG